jgi:hypothetical protein
VTVPVEVLLHRRVARLIKYAAWPAERINAVTGENEARVRERLVQDRKIAGRGGDTVAETLRWSCAEFNLAAWLQGQETGSRQGARFVE